MEVVPPLPAPAQVAVSQEQTTASLPAVPVINYEIVPSLRGQVVRDANIGGVGKNIIIRGKWAMIDAHHGQEGMSSDFELTLQETFTPANILLLQGADKGELKESALSGKYTGWFRLKRVTGTGSDQIQEKDVILSFNMRPQGGFEVSGEGSNKFGNFVLKGQMEADQSIVMYRQYVIKIGGTPAEAGAAKGGKKPAKKVDTAVKAARGVKAPVPAAPAAVVLPGTTNQRDGAGRDRKKSAVMAEAYAITAQPVSPRGAMATAIPAAPIAIAESDSAHDHAAASQRSQRISHHLLRCEVLLKEMMKLPQAYYFLEPVDPIKLGIPDYAIVITNPIDFSTIRTKLHNNAYGSPNDFAMDVRLVFRNAITFNQMRDNPVHIAARELSTKFEERFRILLMQMTTGMSIGTPAELAAMQRAPKSSKSKPKAIRKSVGGSVVGAMGVGYGGVAAVPDGSMVAMQEMQRQMLDMQSEITRLRTTVQHTDVIAGLDQQQLEAQHPLTYAEKKSLISDIHKLPQEHMEGVIEIVAAAKPGTGTGEEEEEVTLDELDTATLRSLQRYVASLKAPKASVVKPQAPLYKPMAGAMPSVPAVVKHAPTPAPTMSTGHVSVPTAAAPAAGGFGTRRVAEPSISALSTGGYSGANSDAIIDFSAMGSMDDMEDEPAPATNPAGSAAWAAVTTTATASGQHSTGGSWGQAAQNLMHTKQREQQLTGAEQSTEGTTWM